MKYFLLSTLALITFAGFFYLLDHKNKEHAVLMRNANAESAKKKRIEMMMLVDPSTGKLPQDYRRRELEYLNNFPYSSQKTTSSGWSQRGPWNVGGRTRALAMDVTNENVLIAASVSGNIYRSEDQGASWKPTLGLLDHQGIVSIAQDTRLGFEHIWYALGGEASGASQSASGAYYFGDGMYKSVDSGKSWQPMASTSGGSPVQFSDMFQTGWRVATSPRTDKDVLYACSVYGIQRSDDGGQTWSIALGAFTNPSNYYTDIDIASTGVVYAALSSGDPSKKGIFRSDDDSVYVDITPTQYINEYGRIVLDINPNNENEVYFFVYMDDSVSNPGAVLTSNYKGESEYISLLKYTYISGDGTGTGGQWEDLSENLPTIDGGPFDKLNCQGGYDMLVKVQPITGHVYIGGTNLYFSTTAFSTMDHTKQIGGYLPLTILPFFEIYPEHHPDQHDVIFSSSDTSLVISASDGGVRSTNDVYASTVSWNNLNGGFFSSQYYTVTIDRHATDDKTLLGGFQDNGNFITFNDNVQSPWVLPYNGDGAYNYIAKNKEFYVMSIQLGKIIKAKLDATGNILDFKRIDPIGPTEDDYNFINPIVVDPNDENYMYVPAGQMIYRQDSLSYITLDNTYDSIASGWTPLATLNLASGDFISTLAISRSPANILYVGTAEGSVYKISDAHSNSPTITEVTSSYFPNGYVVCLAVDETNANNVLVGFSNYGVSSIFYTEDGGASWKRAGGNIDDATFGIPPSIRWLSIVDLPDGSKKYFAGTSIGLFSSDSIKASSRHSEQTVWEREGENEIGAAVIRHIAWRASDGYVVVGTHGNGAFAKGFGFPDGISPTLDYQNLKAYPVPSNTSVVLEIPNGEEIDEIVISDYLGRTLPAVTYEQHTKNKWELDISTLPVGIYYVLARSSAGIYTTSIMKK